MTKVTIERVRNSLGDWTDVVKRSHHSKDPGIEAALAKLLDNSEVCWIGKYEGRIACVFGLIPPTLLSDAATLWLLPTDVINEHQFLFVRYSQRVVEKLLQKYPLIIGTTDQRNRSAIRWVKWLGGEYVGSPANGFISFVIRKKSK